MEKPMNPFPKRRRYLISLTFTFLLILSAVIAVFSERKQQPKTADSAVVMKAERVTEVPAVTSKVKELQIAGVSIIRQGTPKAALAIDVVNNSDSPVISLEITSGDAKDFTSLGIDGLANPDAPIAQIQPHSLKTFEWSLSSILSGRPISLTAATFGNGKEEGDSRAIEMMHKDRANSKAKRQAAQTRDNESASNRTTHRLLPFHFK
jgi:hypothetical protein